ncbi:hypothetical protein SEA_FLAMETHROWER_60 [Microbacterium phage FlameThrower]|nr:hypothetical protein SEA_FLAMETHROWER_60 [Microbacterium phage FlameThrower]
MARPKYTAYSADNEPIAGDDRLDGPLKAIAANHGGYITDKAGVVVYDSRPVEDAGVKPFVQNQLGEFDAEFEALSQDPAVAASTDNTKENEQ